MNDISEFGFWKGCLVAHWERRGARFGSSLPVILSRAGRGKSVPHNETAYKHPNLVERMFNKLKQFRHIATRYDKTKNHSWGS
jgi:transposase